MTLEDRIVCTLWVERESSVERLARLNRTPTEMAYSAVRRLCIWGLVSRPLQDYTLTIKGKARVHVILARRRQELRGATA